MKASFKLFGLYDPDRVRLHAGDFNKTTMEFGRYEDAVIGAPTIAVLLIDGTFHDSYVAALHNLYERVPVGGFVILGDAYHPDVHRAWSDFTRDQKITDELVRIDRCVPRCGRDSLRRRDELRRSCAAGSRRTCARPPRSRSTKRRRATGGSTS